MFLTKQGKNIHAIHVTIIFTLSEWSIMKTFFTSACLLACIVAHADDSPWRLYAAGGTATGGDTVFNGRLIEDETNKVTPFEIKPGTGIPLRLGAEYRLSSTLSLRGSLGRMVTDPMGYNASATFTTTSTEAMGLFFLTDALRLGIGVRQSTAVMQGTGLAENMPSIGAYTGKNGAVIEAQYLFSNDTARPKSRQPQVGVTLRLVSESFQRNDLTMNGDHYEVGLALYF
jgi:hypothetical protein